MDTCDEALAAFEHEFWKEPRAYPLPPSKSTRLDSFAEAVPQRLPLKGIDKESRAAELLNLIGCRMWREGEAVVIGYWPCFMGPELEIALSMVEGPVTILPLSDPAVPFEYCIRYVPWKQPGESLADWIRRRRAAFDAQLSGHDDTDS